MSVRENKIAARPRSFAFSRRTYDTPDVRTGIHVLKHLPGLSYVRPSWNASETVIRIFPGLDPNDPSKFEEGRVSEELGRYGNWQCCYEAVRRFGEPGITMLLHDGTNPHYNAYSQNPCWLLYRAIKDACEKGQGRPEWFPLLNGSNSRGATLQRPTEIVLVQCAVMRHDSKDQYSDELLPFGCNPADPTVVFELTKSVASELFNQIDLRLTDDWKGDSGNNYKYGDPVAINDGVFIHIYERGTDPNPKLHQGAAKPVNPTGWAPRSNTGKGGKGKQATYGYDVHLTKTLDGGDNDIPASLTGNEEMVKSKVRPWGDILEFPTDEQQAHLINPLFPASAIVYAFRDRKSWITDETKKAAVSSVSAGYEPVHENPMAKRAAWNDEVTAPAYTPPVQAPQQTISRPTWSENRPAATNVTQDVAVPVANIPDDTITLNESASPAKQSSAQALEEARARAKARTRQTT